MVKVYVLTVTGEGNGLEHCSVHSSEERAFAYLAAYCRGHWEQQKHSGSLGKDDKKAIKRYFDFWSDENSWDLKEQELDPDPTKADESEEFAALGEDEDFADDEDDTEDGEFFNRP